MHPSLLRLVDEHYESRNHLTRRFFHQPMTLTLAASNIAIFTFMGFEVFRNFEQDWGKASGEFLIEQARLVDTNVEVL